MRRKIGRVVDFLPQFREELAWWIRNDRKGAPRTQRLVKAVFADPLGGIGEPEPLRFGYSGCWSRRITQGRRLVYCVTTDRIDFLQARYHYEQPANFALLYTPPRPLPN